MSHIRFAADPARIPSARLGTGQADLLLACDLVVASAPMSSEPCDRTVG